MPFLDETAAHHGWPDTGEAFVKNLQTESPVSAFGHGRTIKQAFDHNRQEVIIEKITQIVGNSLTGETSGNILDRLRTLEDILTSEAPVQSVAADLTGIYQSYQDGDSIGSTILGTDTGSTWAITYHGTYNLTSLAAAETITIGLVDDSATSTALAGSAVEVGGNASATSGVALIRVPFSATIFTAGGKTVELRGKTTKSDVTASTGVENGVLTAHKLTK